MYQHESALSSTPDVPNSTCSSLERVVAPTPSGAALGYLNVTHIDDNIAFAACGLSRNIFLNSDSGTFMSSWASPPGEPGLVLLGIKVCTV